MFVGLAWYRMYVDKAYYWVQINVNINGLYCKYNRFRQFNVYQLKAAIQVYRMDSLFCKL